MYEPYPVSEPSRQVDRARPPRTVLRAVRLMYAGAALEVVALIVALVTRGSLKSAILKAHPHYTQAQLHTAEDFRAGILAIGALIAWARGSGWRGRTAAGEAGQGASRQRSSLSAPWACRSSRSAQRAMLPR
jgi:hypothetical protein